MQAGQIDERLITALYDDALYGGDWQPALERFRVLLNSAEAALPTWQFDPSESDVHTSGHLLTPEVQEPYYRYYGRIDPKMGVLYRNQVAYLFNDARHFDNAFVARNPFYQEYTTWLGMRHTLDMTLERANGTEVFLAAMRARSPGPYDRRAERIFCQAGSHFLRVLRLREKIEGAQQFGSLARAALERLQIGAFVVSTGARVVLANRLAEDACSDGEELQLRQGQLTARSSKFAQTLGAAINKAVRSHGASALRLPRATEGYRSVWIAPLPAERNIAAGPGAIVLVGDATQYGFARTDDLVALYGLTAAEAEVAVAVGSGASLNEAAAKRGVKLSTVRTQMLSILQKTGARRQADLVRMLSILPCMLLRQNQSR